MSHTPHRLLKLESGQTAIDQGVENGWFMSYNPDCAGFCVSPHKDGSDARVFRDWRNAVQYARTHKVPSH